MNFDQLVVSRTQPVHLQLTAGSPRTLVGGDGGYENDTHSKQHEIRLQLRYINTLF